MVASSWLVCIRCSSQVLRSSKIAADFLIQPTVEKLVSKYEFQPRQVIYFWPDQGVFSPKISEAEVFSSLSNLSTAIYGNPKLSKFGVDARLLLPNKLGNLGLPLEVDDIDTMVMCKSSDKFTSNLPCENLNRTFSTPTNYIELVTTEPGEDSGFKNKNTPHFRQYGEVCLGGTFDQLHSGHKQLLTTACLACSKRLTVGVTTGRMIEKKTLFELIEPIEKRIVNVKNFINDVDPSIEANIVSITDPFGPSTDIENLGVLVISQETVRGGKMVNEERLRKGLKETSLHVIDLLDEQQENEEVVVRIPKTDEDTLDGQVPPSPVEEESKVSSSTRRFHLLGELLKPVNIIKHDTDVGKKPYVIGLTGGIASGKSSVSNRLEKLGAISIDCDMLGHEVYKRSNSAFAELVKRFGKGIVDTDSGEIDRRKLGNIVFSDEKAMHDLRQITWPKIGDLLNARIKEVVKIHQKNDRRLVIVVNAAVLLEANWDVFFNEIWLCIVPPNVGINRVVARDKLSEEDARKRLNSQMSNTERIARSHVVLSTLWRRSVTQYLTEKAWSQLQQRLC